MTDKVSRDSSGQKLYKVLSGKEDYTIAVTGDGQSFETGLSTDDFLVGRFFYRLDGEDRLFALPVTQYAGNPPLWVDVSSGIQAFIWGLDGAIQLNVLNTDLTLHTLSLEYLIYRSSV